MSAFDTTTNTGSTSFTNSYGTIDLLPSASLQHVHGFVRTSGWRYFEVKIENVGGDRSKVFMGYALSPITTPPVETVWGGNCTQAHINAHSALTLDPGAIGTASLTAETGDVFMFAADLTGGGRDHAGVAQTSGTLSSGTGVVMHPNFIEVGKNGVWFTPSVGVIGFEWASGGFPMKAWPVVTRDSTSATAAQLSLKVLSQSFAYTIPTGMVEWGDGPEGGGSLTADASINWDNTKKSDGMSLSGSNLYAVEVGNAGGFPKRDFVYSTTLPTTGKRYIEFTAQQSDSLTFSNWGNTEWCLGLADANIASITSSATEATGLIVTMVPTTSTYKRTVNSSASITNAYGWNSNQVTPTFGMMIDFDNSRMWFVNPNAPGGTSGTPWWGDKQAATEAYGYSFGATSSTDGLTFTASVGTRISAMLRKDYFHAPTPIYLKMNPEGPFESYPLLPGATSMNGSRRVIAHGGDYWDVANNPASMTYGAAELVVIARAFPAMAQARNIKNAGKKYFEIYHESDFGGTTLGYAVGVRLHTATTMTNVNASALIDQGLFFWNIGTIGRQFRYGVTTTWSATESVTTGGAGMAAWQGIAIDFDSGKIWCGTWNKVQHQMQWGAGSDPTTGTGAHMTFTASTTMRIACLFNNSIAVTQRTVLVTDPANVIGKPPGFDPWDPDPTVSLTTTPSAGSSGILNIWPFGIVT